MPSLQDPNQLFGEAGMNRYFGSYEEIGKDGFRALQIARTRMAGPPEMMEQETRFLALLKRANSVRLGQEDDELRLELLENSRSLLTFKPKR